MKRVVPILALAAVFALVIAWLLRGESGTSVSARPEETRAQRAAAEPRPSELTVASGREQAVDLEREAVVGESDPTEDCTPEIDDGCDFIGTFCLPDGKEIPLDDAWVTLRDDAGSRYTAHATFSRRVRLHGLRPGDYALDVRSAEFAHRAQRVQLARRGHVTAKKLVMWSDDFVALAIRRSDGQTLLEVNGNLGVQNIAPFASPIRVRVRRDPPAVPEAPGEPGLADFRPAPVDATGLGDVVGALERRVAGELWVAVQFSHVQLGWQRLAPQARQLVFDLDGRAVEASLASLSLSVVDELGSPFAGTLVALEPPEMQSTLHTWVAESDPNGSVRLERVPPGTYTLRLTRELRELQMQVVLRDSEVRDLGAIALVLGPILELRVVDGQGRARPAWIEIAPHESSVRTARFLHTAMRDTATESDGTIRIPLPTERTVLRASCRASAGRPGATSGNVLIDPQHPPQSPMTIVVSDPGMLVLEATKAGEFEVLDENDLVVERLSFDAPGTQMPSLPPGRYRVRATDADPSTDVEALVESPGSTVRVRVP